MRIAADDPLPLFGDRARRASRTASGGSAAPTQATPRAARIARGPAAEDLAQLLLEQVGAVEGPVEALDVGELCLLAIGQVLGVLPEREAGALQLAGDLVLSLPARLLQTSRRTSSSASVASATTWKGSTQRFACGQRFASTASIHPPCRRRRA